MPSRNIKKLLVRSRLLKNYGSWLYCSECNKTIAYILYTTYKGIKISFTCKCGNKGSIELLEDDYKLPVDNKYENLVKINNRLCCKQDESPLFSVVSKQIDSFEYKVTCCTCNNTYSGKE